MIPTIEDILRDVACGEMSYETALAYIYRHMEMAEERQADSDMRDHFAAMAMASVWSNVPDDVNRAQALLYLGTSAYEMADAMLAAREEPQP